METIKKISFLQFDTLSSTQTWAKKYAHCFDQEDLTCVTALEQTRGMGQYNRPWVSPKAVNIYATLYFTLKKPCTFLHLLSKLLSHSCAKVLTQKGFQPEIKEPNDILLAKKKVAGILCDVTDLHTAHGIFLGIGINLNMDEKSLTAIDQPATSLLQISGRTWERDEILIPLLLQFLKDLKNVESQ